MWHFKWLARIAPKKFDDLGINEAQCKIDIKVSGHNYELEILNPVNNDKKLFVLDIDWTLINDDGTLRPYVHEMLERAYRNYNIILWSGRDKFPHVHIFNCPSYNFVAFLNRRTILPVNTLKNGTLEVKPLEYIWNKLPNFSKRNTVMLDDTWYSYALNRQSGMSTNRENQSTTDGGELKRVSDYLEFIATLDNFALLHHNDWQTNLNKIYNRVESFASIERTAHDDFTIEDITTNSTITLWLSQSTTDHEMSVSSDLIDDQNKIDTDLSGIYSHESEGSRTTGPNDSEKNEELVLVRLDETPEIHFESYIRKDKKLLVINLDIMCNLEEMDFLSHTSLRPYAREFLTAAYLNYEIAIWSKENTRFMKKALDSLGLIYDGFKIAIFVEVEGMQVSINPPAYHRRNVLEKIWSEIPQFSPKNTVLVNSRYETSYNNSASELSIKPYTKERKIIDVELAVLTGYLNQISYVDDFNMLDHTIWREPEKVFEYLEHGEFESESRKVVVSVIYGEENILFENIYPKTSMKDLKELISERIAVPPAAQILRYLVPKHYIAFEYIERLNPFNIPRPRSPRINYASHEIFPGWSPEKLYFDGNMTIGHWSYDSSITLQLSPIGDCILPDIGMDAVTGERIVRIDLSAGNRNIAGAPDYPNDKIPDLRCTLCNPDIYEFMISELVEDLEIRFWNPLREGKKLLVLDVNHTLYDPNPHAEMNRPYLHEFLTRVYVHYDIVLWTEQSEEITLATVQKMGIIHNMNYKIAFCLSVKAILTVPTNEYGSIDTKPLELIWRKFPAYSAKNTIILDDHEFNFALNYQSGYTMKRYEVAKGSCDSLLRTLSGYLEGISSIDDFTKLCHRKLWLPGKIMAIDVNGELITRDSRICLTIQWRGNKLVFLNLNVTTTAQDIKNMVMTICGLAASQFSLRRRL